MNERRRNARAQVSLEVREHTGDGLYFQRATSLSTSGLYLDRTLPHPPGTSVLLSLRLPGDGTPVRVRGEVVAPEARPIGMGVRFIAVSAYDRARIAEYLSRMPLVA